MGRRIEGLSRLLLCALAILLLLAAHAASESDPVRGERAFQRCYACHSADPEEKAKLQGPSLFGIVGRAAGAIPGFEYSNALRRKATEGWVWDTRTIDRFIADPKAVIPGTSMSAPPVRDAQERADIVAYLATLGLHNHP
jgi:cytochrome c